MRTLMEGAPGFILRRQDNWQEGAPQSFIPKVAGNRDYQAYLAWVSAGNTPEAADAPDERSP